MSKNGCGFCVRFFAQKKGIGLKPVVDCVVCGATWAQQTGGLWGPTK